MRVTDPGEEPPADASSDGVAPRTTALVLALLCGLLLIGLGSYPFQEPDEGRYADIAANMVSSGDWITPRLDGIRYFEKPPLVFWLSGLCMKVLGRGEAGARLPSVLAAMAVLLMLRSWGRRAFDGRVALATVVVFATMPLVIPLARSLLVDFVLTAATTLALLGAWAGLVAPERDAPARRAPVLLFWAAAGLAFLTKGPIGLALPGASIGAWLLLTRQWRRIGSLLRPDGLLVFLAVAGPWYVLMSLRNPGFARSFFLVQNLDRFATGGHFDRQKPVWFYLPVLLVGALPWAGALPGAVARAWGERGRARTGAARTRGFLWCAVLAPLGLLSVAHSKLPYYVLPLLPPLALLLADALVTRFVPRRARPDEASARPPRMWPAGLALGGLALVALAVTAVVFSVGKEERLAQAAGTVFSPAQIEAYRAALMRLGGILALVGAACLAGGLLMRRGKPLVGLGTVAGGLIVFSCCWSWMLTAVAPLYTIVPVADMLAAHARADEPIVNFGHYYRGVPFYLGRTVILWNASLPEFGHEPTPEESVGLALQRSPEAFHELLSRHGSVLVLSNSPNDEAEIAELLTDERTEILDRLGRNRLMRIERL